MIASELIVDTLPPLLASETCGKAINWMREFKVSHLPVIDGNKFLGIISEEDLLDTKDENATILESKIPLLSVFVYQYQHIYEVMKFMSDNSLTVIPILDKKDNYIGSTTLSHLMLSTTNITSVKEPGGIIILRISEKGYSLAEIAQIVESNNARILSSFITSAPDSTEMEVTLKVNRTDLGAILQTFDRYSYTIVESYQKENEDRAIIENRYNHLMRMLDL